MTIHRDKNMSIISSISDVHLGDGGNADDFWLPVYRKEEKLLELINSSEILVINGDFADIWENPLKRIVKRYHRVFDCIHNNRNKIIFVRGNHDAKGLPYSQHNIYEIEDYVFMHGNQFDIFNSKWKGIGKAVTKIGSTLERFGFYTVDRIFSALGRGRYGDNQKYFEWIEKFVEKNEKYKGKTIVFGHTHEFIGLPIELSNCKVLNTGTWTGERMDILRIEI
jgi:UDP-2,3-diacylglucosamine pyrophosphatase LpxH